MQPSKVKILESSYDKEKDLIIWNLQFIETGDEQRFCWPPIDLLTSLGVPTHHMETLVRDGHIDDFCSKMLNKEISLAVEGLTEYSPPDIEEAEEVSDQIADHFDTFREHTE